MIVLKVLKILEKATKFINNFLHILFSPFSFFFFCERIAFQFEKFTNSLSPRSLLIPTTNLLCFIFVLIKIESTLNYFGKKNAKWKKRERERRKENSLKVFLLSFFGYLLINCHMQATRFLIGFLISY